MNFSRLLVDKLELSVEDFAFQYELPENIVYELLKTNELPLDLMRKISQRTGMSLKDVMSYESDAVSKIDFVSQDSLISSFIVKNSDDYLSAFDDWFSVNKKVLKLDYDTENWLYCMISRCFSELDGQQNIVDQLEILLNSVREKQVRLKKIVNTPYRYRQLSNKLIVNEPLRLLDEDVKRDEYELRSKEKLKDLIEKLRSDAKSILSFPTIYRLLLDNNRNQKIVYDNLNQKLTSLSLEVKNCYLHFLNEIKDEIVEGYTAMEKTLLAEDIHLINCSDSDWINSYLIFETTGEDLFESVSDEEKQRRFRQYTKSQTRSITKDAAVTFLFPAMAVSKAFSSEEDMANEIRRYIQHMKYYEEFIAKQSKDLTTIENEFFSRFSIVRKTWSKTLLDFDKQTELSESQLVALLNVENEKEAVIVSVIKGVKEGNR